MSFIQWLYGRDFNNPSINGQWEFLHIITLIICIVLIVGITLIFKKKDEKSKRKVMLIISGILIFFELARRIVNITNPITFTKYNLDGSYSQTTYDEWGNEITTNKFDKDGNQIPKNRRRTSYTEGAGNQNSGSQRTNYDEQERHRRADRHSSTQRAQGTKTDSKPETEAAFITRFTDLCAQKKFSTISDTDWAKLASILGTETDIIKNLDHDHYKKLAIKFHPDVNPSEYSHNLTCILNALNERNRR